MVNIHKIRELLKEKGIKSSYLCSKVGKKHTFLADVANGKSSIAEDALSIIANELNTTTEYLKDETEQKEKPIFNKEDELAVKFYDRIKNLSQEDMIQVLDYVRYLESKQDNPQN